MSSTLKKLGIEFKELPQSQVDEAIYSIQTMRLEQILISEGEIFDWQNLLNRPDLVSLKYPEKLGTLIMQDEKESSNSFFIFDINNPLRIKVIATIKSKKYQQTFLIVAIIGIVPFCMEDSRISQGIEIIINLILGIDIILKSIANGFILSKKSYLKNIWNSLNFIAFLFTWCLFLDDSQISEIIKTIRFLRIFRFIEEVSILKIQFNAYVGSFLRVKPVLIPIFLVMIYFSIIGLHLFIGLTERRCRLTQYPIDDIWIADPNIQKLCGIWECPENTYCGSLLDYDLPRNETENDLEAFNWNFTRFDDFFHSLLVVFTFLNVTGWSGTTFMFWKAMTTYVTATYFLIMILLMAFILSNLLLALFYESFMEKSSIKNTQKKLKQEQQQIEEEIKKKNQQQLINRLSVISKQKEKGNQISNFSIYFTEEQNINVKEVEQELFINKLLNSPKILVLNTLFIFISAFVIAYDYDGIPQIQNQRLQLIDFICILYTFFEITVQFCGKGIQDFFSKRINVFDFLIILSQWLLIFYLVSFNQPLIFNDNKEIIFIKSLKILRIFKSLFFAKVFYTIAVLIRSLISTLIALKKILFLWICLIFLMSIFGKHLLQYKMSEQNMTIYYNDLGSSIMAVVNIFYNEEWHITMYKYGRHTQASIVFYIICVIFGQIFFIRLLTAVFLNEFSLHIESVQTSLKPIDYKKLFSKKKIQVEKKEQKLELQQNKQEKRKEKKRESTYLKELRVIGQKKKTNSMINQLQGQASFQNLDEFLNLFQDNQQQESKIQVIKSDNALKQQEYENKTLFIFSEKNPLRIRVKYFIENLPFRVFLIILVLICVIRTMLLTPFLSPESDLFAILKTIHTVNTILFCIQIFLNIVSDGLIIGEDSYLQKSPYNALNFIITTIDIVAIFNYNQLIFNLFSSLRILEFIRIGAELNQNINYVSQALMKAFQTMIQLSIFCFVILLVYGIFATKLLKGCLYYCSISIELQDKVQDKWDCMDNGGSWINKILGFDNVFDSALTLFVTATTEAWLPILIDTWSSRGKDLAPINNHNRWWAVYFQVFFFIGNICMLNMFISLVVNTYQETKIKAQGMSELNGNQREWLQIKNSIHNLTPRVNYELPKNKLMMLFYYFAESKKLKYFWHSIIALNTIILSLFYTRQNEIFRNILIEINQYCILISAVEICGRFIVKQWKQRDIFVIIDFFGIILNLFDLFILQQLSDNFYVLRTCRAVSVAFQLLRNYYIIRRFPELEKLFNTIFSVIPSALAMIFIMALFLYIYASLGMDLLGYLRPQNYIEGFDLHFRKFTTAMFSLIRVASSEQWWALLVDSVHTRTPDFACIYIKDYYDYQEHGFNGCGTYWAYAYYISFHLIFSLVILNLFIASILGAYEEHVKSEQSAISKYQLHDVLNYWAQYDPKGTGFLNYKQFWKLSSEIAICFGVPVKELLDPANKTNFLRALNIPLYEDEQGLMGYLFHDVIVSLTKLSVELKYGVKDLESSSYKGKDFFHDYHKFFKKTPYNSGQMSSIIFIQGKIRTIRNRKKGIKFLDIEALKKELQNQNDAERSAQYNEN
ncbi:unnamed protein product [Paramecium pentaurelia]|uniref:Ion transport domain-containing protein n=1 Tax=Paramecium pentaurelia TaxID=43138 RepID=A0A8S1T1H6_9CILI|nr:unnamed protein product [Paramecium pentaurelia]